MSAVITASNSQIDPQHLKAAIKCKSDLAQTKSIQDSAYQQLSQFFKTHNVTELPTIEDFKLAVLDQRFQQLGLLQEGTPGPQSLTTYQNQKTKLFGKALPLELLDYENKIIKAIKKEEVLNIEHAIITAQDKQNPLITEAQSFIRQGGRINNGILGIFRASNHFMMKGKEAAFTMEGLQELIIFSSIFATVAMASQMAGIVALVAKTDKTADDKLTLSLLTGNLLAKMVRYPTMLAQVGQQYGVGFAKSAGHFIKDWGMAGGLNVAGGVVAAVSVMVLIFSAKQLYDYSQGVKVLERARNTLISDYLSNPQCPPFLNEIPKEELADAILTAKGKPDVLATLNQLSRDDPDAYMSLRSELQIVQTELLNKQQKRDIYKLKVATQLLLASATVVAAFCPPAAAFMLVTTVVASLGSYIYQKIKETKNKKLMETFKAQAAEVTTDVSLTATEMKKEDEPTQAKEPHNEEVNLSDTPSLPIITK